MNRSTLYMGLSVAVLALGVIAGIQMDSEAWVSALVIVVFAAVAFWLFRQGQKG